MLRRSLPCLHKTHMELPMMIRALIVASLAMDILAQPRGRRTSHQDLRMRLLERRSTYIVKIKGSR